MDGSGAPGGSRRRAWTAEIDDLDRLCAVQPEADVQHTRTRPGPFALRMVVADFGLMRLQSAAVTNSYLVRGSLRGSFHAVLMTTRPRRGTRLNGMAVDAGDAVALRARSEVFAHVEAGHRWMALMLHPSAFAEALAPLGLDQSGRVVARGMLDAAPRLRPFLAELAEQAAEAPGLVESAAVAGAVIDETRHLLEVGLGGTTPARTGLADGRRLRLFRETLDFLDTVLDRPVYSAAVGEAVGAEPRAVNAAFRAVYGMTLHRYLLLRRLDLARRRLSCGGDGAARVKTVALDLGFWHLGRFALDYRAMYGETPSATLARGRARIGAPEEEEDRAA